MHSSILMTSLLTLLAGSAMAFNFNVYPTGDCSGTGTAISGSSIPAKGNFNPRQGSFRITSLPSGQHVTFYTGSNQSGDKAGYYGTTGCVSYSSLSYGVYAN